MCLCWSSFYTTSHHIFVCVLTYWHLPYRTYTSVDMSKYLKPFTLRGFGLLVSFELDMPLCPNTVTPHRHQTTNRWSKYCIYCLCLTNLNLNNYINFESVFVEFKATIWEFTWLHMRATEFVFEGRLPAALMGSGWLVQWWLIWKQTATGQFKVKKDLRPTNIFGRKWQNWGEIMKMASALLAGTEMENSKRCKSSGGW